MQLTFIYPQYKNLSCQGIPKILSILESVEFAIPQSNGPISSHLVWDQTSRKITCMRDV